MKKISIRKAAQKIQLANIQQKAIETPCTPVVIDRWEMDSANLILKEKIGKGAFGQVYTANVEFSNMSSMYKQSINEDGNKTSFQKHCMIKVAVKLLKGSDNYEMIFVPF